MKNRQNHKKKLMAFMASATAFFASPAFASGYYLPEQSTNSIALAAAYIANAHGPDAAFYNPANLVFEESDQASLEMDLLWVHSPEIDFSGDFLNGAVPATNSAEEQDVLAPNFFYVSPDMGNNWRFGLSSYSTGLKTDWKSGVQLGLAEKADIQSTEITPVASYKFNDQFSVGGGVRFAYTDARLKNAQFDMEGDGFALGYNLAATFKPLSELTLSATYRSKITTKLKGDAYIVALNASVGGDTDYILPANLGLGAAYKFSETTLELTYNRLYWSDYKSLYINLNGLAPVNQAKNWSDTHTYRIGLTHAYSKDLTLMAGIAFDESPIPDATQAFEILDNDFTVYGLGAKYRIDDSWTFGGSMLFADGDGRTFTNNIYQGDGLPNLSGSFDRDLYVYNVSLTYSF